MRGTPFGIIAVMRRGQKLQAAFVVTVVGGALAAGCSSGGRSSDERVIVNPPFRDSEVLDDADDAAPDAPACPSTPPLGGEPCDPSRVSVCTWGGMPCPPYSPTDTTARCVSGRWQVSTLSCNPPPPSPDGGDVPEGADASDVQDVADVADVTDATTCPMRTPTVGEACARTDPTPCAYTVPCPGNLPISVQFVCARELWQVVSGAACNPPVDGGPSGDVPGG